MLHEKPTPGTGGKVYLPYQQRSGEEAVVYFTRDLSPEGLRRITARVLGNLTGRVGVKLHTGEPNGPNIIPHDWVRTLIQQELPQAVILETNTYYDGERYTTPQHRKTLETNGWTFCPVDILDEEGTAFYPIQGGKWFTEMSMGRNLERYDSLLALTHFKGHAAGGFGGSNKNLGIGCADGRIGKAMIHTTPGSEDQWDIAKEEFMERMTESTKAILDHFGPRISYVNVLRNMSVSCDCEGVDAAPVETPNIGILASLDLLAIDQASVDLIYALGEKDRRDMVKRIESRHGLRQLSYMKELGMGHDRYRLLDIDQEDRPLSLAEAVKDVVPFAAVPFPAEGKAWKQT